jgi:hypothetical protein
MVNGFGVVLQTPLVGTGNSRVVQDRRWKGRSQDGYIVVLTKASQNAECGSYLAKTCVAVGGLRRWRVVRCRKPIGRKVGSMDLRFGNPDVEPTVARQGGVCGSRSANPGTPDLTLSAACE